MEARGGRKRATVDINDVMASLSELGVPEDVQRHCYEMLQQQSSDKGGHGKKDESSSFPSSSEISTDDVPTLDSGQGLSSRKNSDASDDLWQRRGSTGSDFGRRMRPPPFVSSRGSADMLGRSARDGSVDSSKSFDGLVGRLSADARLIHHQAGRMHGNAALGQTSRLNSPDRDVRVQQQQQQQQRALRSEDKHQTVALACPRSMVGRVIGKAGDTIKALQQYTNTSIQIDQSTNPSKVTITGSDKSVRMTVAMISDIINGRFKGFAILRQIASMSPAGSRGSSTDGIGGYGIGGTDTTLSYYGAGGGGVGGSGSGGQQQQQAQDDDWQPTYVQGYGFIPPVSPADSVIHRLSHDRDRRSIGSDGGSIGSDGGSLGGRRIIGSPASAPLGPTLGYTDNVLVGGGSVQGFGFGSTGQGFPQELGQSVAPAAPHPHASDQILHREAVLKKLMESSLNQQQQQQQQQQEQKHHRTAVGASQQQQLQHVETDLSPYHFQSLLADERDGRDASTAWNPSASAGERHTNRNNK